MEAFKEEPEKSVHETAIWSVNHAIIQYNRRFIYISVSVGSSEMHPKWQRSGKKLMHFFHLLSTTATERAA